MSNDNVKQLPNANTDSLRASLEQIRRDLPVILEMEATKAQIRKASYEASLAAGFNEEQAIAICLNAV